MMLLRMHLVISDNDERESKRYEMAKSEKLVLDKSDESLDTGLKHMKPGQYTFWATYYNHGNPEERSNQLLLTSNKV